MKLRDPFEREGEKLNLSALLVHAIISKLKGKKKNCSKFSLYYTKSFLCLWLLRCKKKGHFRILSLCITTHLQQVEENTLVFHLLIIFSSSRQKKQSKCHFSEETTESYKKENFYLLCPLFSQHPNKIYCREGERSSIKKNLQYRWPKQWIWFGLQAGPTPSIILLISEDKGRNRLLREEREWTVKPKMKRLKCKQWQDWKFLRSLGVLISDLRGFRDGMLMISNTSSYQNP